MFHVPGFIDAPADLSREPPFKPGGDLVRTYLMSAAFRSPGRDRRVTCHILMIAS